MKIENTKVSTRLITGFGVVLAFLLFILVQGVLNMQHLHQQMQQTVKFNVEEARLARVMYLSVTERALAFRNIILSTEPSERQLENERIALRKPPIN